MAATTQKDSGKKKTETQNTQNTQTVTVGGREITVSAPKTSTPKPSTSTTPSVYVGGRDITKQVEQQKTRELVNAAKKQSAQPAQTKVERQQVENPYKKSYTENDYNNLKNTLYESAQDPYYDMMWSNVEYKDMWDPQAQKDFDDYNNFLNRVGEEAQVAKGDVATQKEIQDTQGSYVIDDVVDRAKNEWRSFDKDLQTYNVELEDLVAKNQQYESLMEQLGDGEEYQKYKAESDVMKNRIDELNTAIGDIKGKQAYQNALQKRLQFEFLRENGSKDEFVEYSKYAGSYMNNLLDDIALNYEAAQFRKLAGVQTFIENVRQSYGENEAKRITETITKLYENGDVTEEEKDEVLAYAQNIVDKNTAKPGESIGVQLNDIANQLSMMQENGESATEKLFVDVVGNVLDNSIGQLGPAIAFGRAGMMASTALMSMSGYTQVYQQDIEAGFTHEEAMLDALMQSGVEYMTELIGGERILRFADGEILPRTFGEMIWEGAKSGAAESVEEALGWGATPLAHFLATGDMPSIESWNPEELKQAVSTAFLAGFVQAEVSADYSQFGMAAPLTQTEQVLDRFLTISTDEGKNRVQSLINELDVMGRDASWRKNIFLADGTRISEKDYIETVKKIAEKNIADYENKIQVKGVEIIDENRIDPIMSLAEDSKYSLKNCLEVTRQEKINSLMQSLNAGEVIQNINEQYDQDLAKKMVAQESERLAEIQKQLDKDGVKVKAPMWEQLSDEAKTNATIVSKVSDVIGGTPIEFADLRTKDGKIVDGFYDNGKIIVNPNAKLGAISTFIHEYTHGIEANRFYSILRDEVKFLYGKEYQTLVKDIKKQYSDIKKLSQEDAERELTAKTVQKMLGNKKFVERLVKYHTDMAYKMYTDLKSMTTYSTVAESMAQTFLKAFNDNDLKQDELKRDGMYSVEFNPATEPYDNEGAKLSKGQKEYFDGTKLVDGLGRLLRIFHTSRSVFDKFDPRGTDYYRFGDKIVNYFSTSRVVSGSYANGKYETITGEKYFKNREKVQQKIDDLRKEAGDKFKERHQLIVDMEKQADAVVKESGALEALDQIEKNINGTDIFDINSEPLLVGEGSAWNGIAKEHILMLMENIRSKSSNPITKLTSINELLDLASQNQFYHFKTTQNMADIFSPITNINVLDVLKTIDKYQTETNRLEQERSDILDEIDKLKNSLNGGDGVGKQYEGYGKALNPYILENESGIINNWNELNDSDWHMTDVAFDVVSDEIANALESLTDYDVNYLNTKNRINRFILENTNPVMRKFLAENPLALANYTNQIKKELEGIRGGFGSVEEMAGDIRHGYSFRDGFPFIKTDDYGGVHFKGRLETNDVVKAVLAINDYTDNPYDGVIFRGITDSASYSAEGVESDIIALFDSNQFKLIENKNPTESDNINFSYVADDDFGYHYGASELDYNKKSETLWQRSGRGTGAFGTGTYVFGEEGKNDATYFTKDRTEHKIDMSDYNLFKVKDTDQGYRLHQLFKELDDNYYYTGPKTIQELQTQISSIIDDLNEIEYDEEGEAKLTTEQEETIREQLLELGDTERQIDKMFDENRNTKGGSVLADYLADSLNERYIEDDYWRDRPHSLEMAERQEELMSHIPELAKILGEDEDYMYDVVNEAIRSAEIDSNKRDFMGGKYDSVGTRVMKKLGYEGIDVRGIKGLDNSTYGSVIYDLNPDTVRYSYDSENDIINEETNDELERLQKPNSALSEEQLALYKSRDPAFLKGVRGRIETLFRSRYDSGSSSNNDSKRIIKVSGDDFYEFFKANKNYLKNPETVDLLNKEDYQDGTAYMSNNGLSGFYITKDGDLKSVFNDSGKHGFPLDIADIVKKDAYTLDCFQSEQNKLADMYAEAFGFKVASILDFNRKVMEDEHGKEFTRDFIKKYGKAPIYFMVKTDQDVKTEHFNKDQWQEAYDYRNSFVNKVIDDLNVSEADMKKYKMIKPVTERTKSIDKNIDKNTGVYKPQGIIELESTIGKTTHEEEIKDGEEYAGKVAQQLDNGADPEDILKQLKANPLNNGLIRAYYTSQVLADRGLKSEYMELVQWARDIDNLGGKLVESTKILYDLSDTFSRAVYLTTVQDNLVDEYKLKYGNKDVDVDKIINDIFQKSFDAITHSETIREFRKAVGNLAREVNRVMPKTIWDRITQYRMIAMLSGTKTAVSNFISNVFTTGLYRMKDFNQAAIEAAVQQITVREIDDVKQYGIKQGDRQTTFKLDKEATKRNKEAAKEIFDQLEEASKTKYGDDVEKIPDVIKKRLKEAHATTKKPIAKALDNLTELVQSVQQTMLDDSMFTKGAFVYKFNQLAQARGIDIRTVDRLSKEFNKLVDDAYDYAEEVVSHDATDISNTLSNLQKRSAKNVRVNQDSTLVGLDTAIKRFKERANEGQKIYKAMDAVIRRAEPLLVPFYKTNASVMKKALQYSPLEIVQVINDYSRVKANKMDLVDMVEHMAKFAAGTELYILGAIFSRLGWLKWDKDDEDYTGRLIVKIPGTDKGITADFIDPVSTIFTKGVVLNQELMEEGVSFKFLADLVNDYEDIFLADELDMFSTMKDFFDTVGKVRKGKDDYGEYTIKDGAADVAFTILNSYIPAIVRDISRIVDPAKKVTYTSDQKKYLSNRLLNSTPFRTKLVDKKDATGNTLTYTQPYTKNDLANRVITQMVSRGKLVDMEGKAITTTQIDPDNKLGDNASEFMQMAQDFQFKDDNGDGYSDQHWIRETVPTNIYPGNEQVELTPEEKDTYGKTWTDTWTTGANSLINNDTYKNLSYENQADVVYELQAFSRRVIEAEYCQNNKMEMTDSQKTALKLKEFCTKNGKLNGDLLSLIALGTAKENKLSNGGQQYVLGKKGEDGKTIRNSRQLYMRQLYEEAGVYDDILKAVERGDFEYADFGLSKTVVKQSEDKSKANYQDIYNKTMSKSSGSKTSGKKAKKSSAKKISGGSLKGGGSVNKLTQAKIAPAKSSNMNFFKAYQNTFNQRKGSSKVSESGSSSQVCPNCGARVSPNASRCPNCGARL